jgi:hypothetical protein
VEVQDQELLLVEVLVVVERQEVVDLSSMEEHSRMTMQIH